MTYGLLKCQNRRGRPMGKDKKWVDNALCYRTLGRLPLLDERVIREGLGRILERASDKKTAVELIMKFMEQYIGGSHYCPSCKAFVNAAFVNGEWLLKTEEASGQDFKHTAKVRVKVHQMVVA